MHRLFRRRPWLLAMIAGPILLGAGPDFEGCGDSAPSTGGVLPAQEAECFIDSDCTADLCMISRCIARRCVEFGRVQDRDGDGFIAAPCGRDCSDTDALVNPDATEICNRTDDDCDTRVDEGIGLVIDEEFVRVTAPFLVLPANDEPSVARNFEGSAVLFPAAEILSGSFRPLGDSALVFAATIPAPGESRLQLGVLSSAGLLSYERFETVPRTESVFGPELFVASATERASLVNVGGTTVVFHDGEVSNTIALSVPEAGGELFTMPGFQESDVFTDGTHAIIRTGGTLFFVALDGTVTRQVERSAFMWPNGFASGRGKIYVAQPGRLSWMTAAGETGELEYTGLADEVPILASDTDFLYAHVRTATGPALLTFDLETERLQRQIAIDVSPGWSLQAVHKGGEITALVAEGRTAHTLVRISECVE